MWSLSLSLSLCVCVCVCMIIVMVLCRNEVWSMKMPDSVLAIQSTEDCTVFAALADGFVAVLQVSILLLSCSILILCLNRMCH